MIALLLACAPETSDSGDAGPVASDTTSEVAGAVIGTCNGDVFEMQIGFTTEVNSVVAEVRTDAGGQEFHDLPFAGMDESTETVFIHEAELEMGGAYENGQSSAFSCDDSPYAGYRAYDSEGAIMACHFGEFVADQFDSTGCPE